MIDFCNSLKLLCSLVLLSALAYFTPSAQATQPPLKLLGDVALSPDGSLLAFCWSGEIWSVSIDGGQDTRLTNHPANDSQPNILSRWKEPVVHPSRRRSSRHLEGRAQRLHCILVATKGVYSDTGYLKCRNRKRSAFYSRWQKPVVSGCSWQIA